MSDSLNFLVTVDDEMWGHVYRSSSLFGNWIKQENHVRWGNETRPGGRIFNVDNDLFIPFQNYSKGYGTGISLYKIVLEEKKKCKNLHQNCFCCKNQNCSSPVPCTDSSF